MAVFSVSERGGDMVQETAVEPPARLPRGVVALSAVAGVLWCVLTGLGGALSFSKVEFRGWHAVVGVVGLIAAGVFSANVASRVERTYGQYDAGIRVAGVSAWAGIGTGATLCATSAYAADAGWWALLPGAVGTACLLRVPF
ncbi:MAG: hypothetical protein HOP97_05830, partial [Terrabacter sp.]|nr:hypothetical protein [Terrabacter sp.]